MRKAILILALAAAPLAHAAEDVVKVINVKYKPADSLARMINVVGGLVVNPNRDFNTITLRGQPDMVKMATALIEQYDTPRRAAEFVLRVIEAGELAKSPNDAADLVPAELKSMLRYSHYSQRDSAVLRGLESEQMIVKLGGNMGGRLNFRVRDSQLEVSVMVSGATTLIKGKEGAENTYSPTLLETSAIVKNGETVVLGASKMSGGPSALIVLLTAKLLP